MLQDRAILLGVAALATVATAGWMRQPQAATTPLSGLMIPADSFTAPAGTMLDPAYASAPPVATPVSATAVPVRSGVYRTAGGPVARTYPGVAQEGTRGRHADPDLRRRPAPQPRIVDRDVDDRPETVVQERSKMKSAAIIAGGAAAGAAVGGLAGGKKGAAIGAIGGGAAGLIYDRMTKNR